MKNIFVGNLSIDVTEDELRRLFQPYGLVKTTTLVKDRDTGDPRGFAFVEMPNDNEAEIAIAALDGMLVREQPLTVNEARPKLADASGAVPLDKRKSPREELPTRTHRRHRY